MALSGNSCILTSWTAVELIDMQPSQYVWCLQESKCAEQTCSWIYLLIDWLLAADDVPPTAPRLLINRERVGEGAVAAAAADCRRQTGCNAPDSSSSSDEDCTGSSCDADDGDDTGSGSGTDIEGLISDVDSNDADVGASKGFDFLASSGRDALCLGDCDSSVRRLASMLGWGQELEELVAEAAAAAAEDEAEC